MGNTRQPGPFGRRGSSITIDMGTKVRTASPRPGTVGKKKHLSPKDAAKRLVRRFRSRSGTRAFSKMSRSNVASGLLKRIEQPALINQRNTRLCGPASVVFAFATHDPVRYVRFVIDLFEDGKAKFGKLDIEPSDDCKNSRPRKSKKNYVIDDVDWIALASLRDNSNTFLSVENSTSASGFWAGLEGVTTASQIMEWFEDAGYQVVMDEASTFALISTDEDVLKKAMVQYDKGNFVLMCLDPDVLTGKSTSFQRHWVVLTGPIWLLGEQVSFDCFTWGDGKRTVAADKQKFLDDFYGFISMSF